MKRFLKWFGLKERLHFAKMRIPLVSEGQIWWASLGENIGREINGKNESFARPVLIYKKLATDYYFVIPLTTKMHTGSWYVPYQHQGMNAVACLHQARSIDYLRLRSKLGELEENYFLHIKKGFQSLYQ